MSTEHRPALEPRPEEGLDPEDWEALRALAHRMVDDVVDYHRGIGARPAWRPIPDAAREALGREPPRAGIGADRAYEAFLEHVLPYPFGNIHPRTWGWVNGTGTTLGALAELLAATMNPNVWGGEHAAAYVEAQVLAWAKRVLGFPPQASGVLTSGGSLANLIGVAVAREARGGGEVSGRGLHALGAQLVVYASEQVHNSVDKAAGLLGIGWQGLRKIPTDREFRMDVGALEAAIADDRAAGRRPFCVVGTAGTVNTGAIDELDRIADICAREGLWFHVDGAIGALAALSPALRPLLRGIERADSIAFDLHKWLHIPIEAGCVLVRHPEAHRAPFSPPASYLAPMERGLASGPHSYMHLGPQLTRGFRALKVWLSLHAHGTDVYGRLVEQNVRQARHLEARIREHPRLELLAPVPLNIVCFRYRPEGAASPARHAGRPGAAGGPGMPGLGTGGSGADAAEPAAGRRAAGAGAVAIGASTIDAPALDALNRELLMRLQESGAAVPSGTVIRGAFALRIALTNHRTRTPDLDAFVEAAVRIGDALAAEAGVAAGG